MHAFGWVLSNGKRTMKIILTRSVRKLGRAVGFGVAATIALVSGAKADLLADVKERGELVVATEMQFAPFDFLVDGEYTGVDKDLFDEFGKELGVKVRFIDLPWPSILPALEAGKFDMVGAPVTITKKRVERYAFTLPFSTAAAGLLKRAGNDAIQKPEDIAGKPTGGGKGNSQTQQLREFIETLPSQGPVRDYIDMNQAYADLMTGRIVAVANSMPNLAYMARQHSDRFALVQPAFGAPSYFGFVTRKTPEDQSLITALNKIILKMKKDGRMDAIHMKWFGIKMDLPDTPVEPTF
jgi:polar amino acid transport system substrate-binding protein